MEESTWYAPKNMGGAPPHKNNLIGTATVGGSKSSWLKMNTTAFSSLLFTCSLADEPEASSSSGRAGPPLYHQAEADPLKEFNTSSKS